MRQTVCQLFQNSKREELDGGVVVKNLFHCFLRDFVSISAKYLIIFRYVHNRIY